MFNTWDVLGIAEIGGELRASYVMTGLGTSKWIERLSLYYIGGWQAFFTERWSHYFIFITVPLLSNIPWNISFIFRFYSWFTKPLMVLQLLAQSVSLTNPKCQCTSVLLVDNWVAVAQEESRSSAKWKVDGSILSCSSLHANCHWARY